MSFDILSNSLCLVEFWLIKAEFAGHSIVFLLFPSWLLCSLKSKQVTMATKLTVYPDNMPAGVPSVVVPSWNSETAKQSLIHKEIYYLSKEVKVILVRKYRSMVKMINMALIKLLCYFIYLTYYIDKW